MCDLSALLLLAEAKGTDQEFRSWINKQPSCLTGEFSEWTDDGWRNMACHVRRAGESGTGYKAPYACVPMTNEEHGVQHHKGEAFVLNKYLRGQWDRDSAKEWFDQMRIEYLQRWINS